MFRHAQAVSDGDAEELYCCRSLSACWYWRRIQHAHLSAFVEENDFRVFRRIYLQIIGPCPCLAVGQLCLSTAVYVFSVNLTIWFPCVIGLKSAAFTMYVAGPMPEP